MGIAYILTTAVLVYLSTRGKMSSDSASFKGLACITSVVGCFLFAWFICGLVWFFSTTEDDCDKGLYQGSKVYFILTLVVSALVLHVLHHGCPGRRRPRSPPTVIPCYILGRRAP